jgi:hypothetical protein
MNFGRLESNIGTFQGQYQVKLTYISTSNFYDFLPIYSNVVSLNVVRYRHLKTFFSINNQYAPSQGIQVNPNYPNTTPIIVKHNIDQPATARAELQGNNFDGIEMVWKINNNIIGNGATITLPNNLINGNQYALTLVAKNGNCLSNHTSTYTRLIEIRDNRPIILLNNIPFTPSMTNNSASNPMNISCNGVNIQAKMPFAITNKTFVKINASIINYREYNNYFNFSFPNGFNMNVVLPSYGSICASEILKGQIIKMAVLVEDGPLVSEKTYFFKIQ